MDTDAVDLSIVIVTWNARDYAQQCLKSLRQQDARLLTETIIVDNASSDGVLEMIRSEFSSVRLIENTDNLGFAKANNIGISRSRGKYICLINSDVYVPPDCLRKMHAYMEQNQDVGAVSPRMRGRNGKVGRSYMRFPTVRTCLCHALALDSLFRGCRTFGGTMMTDFCNDETSDMDVLNGWFLMVRREALGEVGLLDERFFMYGEDIEWSYRFAKAGWRRVYFAGAEALHYGGASSSKAPTRFYLEMQWANIQFWKKHHSRMGVFGYVLTIWLHELVRILGHSFIYFTKESARQDAGFKVRRGLACLSWLSRVCMEGKFLR